MKQKKSDCRLQIADCRIAGNVTLSEGPQGRSRRVSFGFQSRFFDSSDSLRMTAFGGRLLARTAIVLATLVALPSSATAAEVKVTKSGGNAKVSVIRRVDLDYHLLTKAAPLEFTVAGPTWLRVYTRAWLTKDAKGTQAYGLSLWQEDVERPIEFSTEVSKSSYGPNRQPVGAWRSFFVEVPAGSNPYRLALNDAPAGTVGVRFGFEGPRPWQPVALPGLPAVRLAEGPDTSNWSRVQRGNQAALTVSGPARFRVRLRLDYDPSMLGAQNLVLTVREGDKVIASDNLRVTQSGTASYLGSGGQVPSTQAQLRFRLGEGEHALSLMLNGTLAKSGVIRVEKLGEEKYE